MPASSLLPTAQTGCRSLDRNQKQLRLTIVIVAARLPKEHGSLVCGSRSKVGTGSRLKRANEPDEKAKKQAR